MRRRHSPRCRDARPECHTNTRSPPFDARMRPVSWRTGSVRPFAAVKVGTGAAGRNKTKHAVHQLDDRHALPPPLSQRAVPARSLSLRFPVTMGVPCPAPTSARFIARTTPSGASPAGCRRSPTRRSRGHRPIAGGDVTSYSLRGLRCFRSPCLRSMVPSRPNARKVAGNGFERDQPRVDRTEEDARGTAAFRRPRESRQYEPREAASQTAPEIHARDVPPALPSVAGSRAMTDPAGVPRTSTRPDDRVACIRPIPCPATMHPSELPGPRQSLDVAPVDLRCAGVAVPPGVDPYTGHSFRAACACAPSDSASASASRPGGAKRNGSWVSARFRSCKRDPLPAGQATARGAGLPRPSSANSAREVGTGFCKR